MKKLRVIIDGQGLHYDFDNVTEYETVGFPASTYHKLWFGKTFTLVNDFGVRTVTVSPM